MKKLLIFVFTMTMALVLSTEMSAQKPKRAVVTCGPYVQCVSETGFTVIWTTDVESVAWVEIAPDEEHISTTRRDQGIMMTEVMEFFPSARFIRLS